MIQVQNNNVQKIQEVPQRPVTNNLPHGGYHMPRSVTFSPLSFKYRSYFCVGFIAFIISKL